ncbi:MAG: hypothetical protein KDE27_09285 [Planctomycetes bacterium]|nr:hypothetical protein [Planctomycetota bacterium]
MLAEWLTLSTLTLALAPQGPTATFSDNTFQNGSWTSSWLTGGGGTATGATTQVLSGNPGPAMEVSHSYVTSVGITRIEMFHLMNAAVYDPSTSGPIGTIGCQLEYRALGPNDLHAVRFVIAQGSQMFISRYPQAWWLSTSYQAWVAQGPFALTATDFVEQLGSLSYNLNSHPDFSVAGAPLTFGFGTHSDTVATTTLTVAFDNFFVAINGVPATVAVRRGNPPNPDVLRPVSTQGPAIGTTWGPVIDHSTFLPNATLDFLGFGFTPASVATPYGVLLCSPVVDSYALAAGQPFLFPIPNDPGLVGTALCLQAGSTDPASGVFLLTNALDVWVGTF